jgi:hypothetical protein
LAAFSLLAVPSGVLSDQIPLRLLESLFSKPIPINSASFRELLIRLDKTAEESPQAN